MIPTGRFAGYGLALITFIFLLSGLAHLRGSEVKLYSNRPSLVSSVLGKSGNILDVQNRTLGFERIFAISLPERLDKRDGMQVAASLSNLSIQFVNGIYGDKVSPKALPVGFHRQPSITGSWRAHMKVALKMVEENIQSALIFEDDADWDVALKQQMREFARGSRYLLNTTAPIPHSPYGDDWDMLWLGHCGILEQRYDPRRWVIENDFTVEPSLQQLDNVDTPTIGPFGREHTRMVFRSANGCCVAAYALTLSGARKSLNRMSLREWDGPVDWGWNDLCRNGVTDFTCIAPFPQLFGVHRPAGNQSRWSDIETVSNNTMGKAHSLHLVFPVRMNIERLLTKRTKFITQYPNSTGAAEMEFEDIINFKGHPDRIKFELGPLP